MVPLACGVTQGGLDGVLFLYNIYGLFDPRDPQRIMYVGKGAEKRAASHWKLFLRCGKAMNAFLRHWFEKLKAENIQPGWRFLEENVVDWETAEKNWIVLWRVVNPDLCNVADGGNEWPNWSTRISHILHPEKMREACKKGGHRLKELHPEIAHQCGMNPNSLAALVVPRPTEHYQRAGRIGGRRLKQLHPEIAHQCGMNRNSKMALHKARTIAHQKFAALSARHKQWHVKRGIVNPTCQLCRPNFIDIWEGQGTTQGGSQV
jgi:hypothetical protein